jgi:hypothetical protein
MKEETLREVVKSSHIMCTSADDSNKKVYITKNQVQTLLNKEGGYREKHKRVAYMKVELNNDGTRCNMIKVFAADDTYICAIACRDYWFICG